MLASVPALTGPVLAAAALLALAAPGKLRRPASTANALAQLGLPRSTGLVRLLGVGELVLAAAVWLRPTALVLAALAVAYLAFAGFVAVALRSGTSLSSCGCFGRPDTPPTVVHLVVVAAAALVAGAAAVTGTASLHEVVTVGRWYGVPLVLGAALTTFLAWAALAVLPRVVAASRGDVEVSVPTFGVAA
jgi:hypothetical protein